MIRTQETGDEFHYWKSNHYTEDSISNGLQLQISTKQLDLTMTTLRSSVATAPTPGILQFSFFLYSSVHLHTWIHHSSTPSTARRKLNQLFLQLKRMPPHRTGFLGRKMKNGCNCYKTTISIAFPDRVFAPQQQQQQRRFWCSMSSGGMLPSLSFLFPTPQLLSNVAAHNKRRSITGSATGEHTVTARHWLEQFWSHIFQETFFQKKLKKGTPRVRSTQRMGKNHLQLVSGSLYAGLNVFLCFLEESTRKQTIKTGVPPRQQR